MATILSFLSGRQITNINGAPQAGAKLYHYQAGTTNNLTVYSNQAGTTPHAQPVECDAGGFVPLIYVGSDSDWKVVVENAAGATLQTYDNLPKAVAEVSAANFAPPLLEWTQVTSASSPVALTAADAGKAYEANTTSGDVEFDLPSAASVGNGKGFWFKKTAAPNAMILDPSGSETIDDSSTSLSVTAKDVVIGIFSNGAEYYQIVDALTLRADAPGNLTAGFTSTPFDAGTQTTGTFTPDPLNGNLQRIINNGAHTLAPPASDCSLIVQYTNGASAGAITTSGFTLVDGALFTTTNGHDFLCYITRVNGFHRLSVAAMQ
jgi:hypothetical protein